MICTRCVQSVHVCVCVCVCVCMHVCMYVRMCVFVCVSRRVQAKWELLAARTKLSKKKAAAFEIFKESCVLPLCACVCLDLHTYPCVRACAYAREHVCLMASACLCASGAFVP